MFKSMKIVLFTASCLAMFSAGTHGMNERLPPGTALVTCSATIDAADGFRLYITALDTATTTQGANERAFWQLPAVAASDIHFVTDSAACDHAARAHAAKIHADTTNPATVYLLRVGSTRYIAFNFTKVGEWFHYAILDSTFAIVGTRGS